MANTLQLIVTNVLIVTAGNVTINSIKVLLV